MEHFQDELNRLAEILKSIEPTLNYPNDTRSKAQVMRARLGSINVPFDESTMIAICFCGWRGTMFDCDREQYNSSPESWAKLAGRQGLHWNCPECKSVIWRYYNVIN